MPSDLDHMREALSLAARARGATRTNPMVGCVITDAAGRLVGRGYHERYGEAHAEVNALAEAGERSRGGTVYVTLEPCSHFGKTPPCADAVIAAGPARVVVAMEDPFPQVSGRGLDKLQAAGIAVEVGLCQREARLLNAAFLKRVATGHPFVTAKYAMTLDGRTAARTGHSKWISGPDSRAIVHTLRGQHDAILAGIGTVLADDPLLTARPPGPAECRRFVIDPFLKTPPTSQLACTAADDPVTLLCREDADTPGELAAATGLEIVRLPVMDGALSIGGVLDHLAGEQIGSVFVEGGGRTLGRFFDADQVDQLHVFVAPKLVGGVDATGPIGGHGRDAIPQASDFATYDVTPIGDDIHISGLLKKPWLPAGS